MTKLSNLLLTMMNLRDYLNNPALPSEQHQKTYSEFYKVLDEIARCVKTIENEEALEITLKALRKIAFYRCDNVMIAKEAIYNIERLH